MTRFDGNQAWNEAMRLVSANREVLLVMAGVFVFLPAVAMAFFTGPQQAEMITTFMNAMKHGAADFKDPAFMAKMQAMNAANASLMPYTLLLMLASVVGKLGMMALLTDHRRPTVGEALMIGVKSLPTLIAVAVLLFIGYLVFIIAAGLAIGLPAAMLGMISQVLVGVFAVVAVIALMAAIAVIVTRLSMIYPVTIIEGESNPIEVIKGSWRMVKGNTRRLFLFFLLLLVAYFVVMSVAAMVLIGLVTTIAGKGLALTLGTGIVQGVLAAAFSVVITAVLVAIHRQLAGASPQSLAETFS